MWRSKSGRQKTRVQTLEVLPACVTVRRRSFVGRRCCCCCCCSGAGVDAQASQALTFKLVVRLEVSDNPNAFECVVCVFFLPFFSRITKPSFRRRKKNKQKTQQRKNTKNKKKEKKEKRWRERARAASHASVCGKRTHK